MFDEKHGRAENLGDLRDASGEPQGLVIGLSRRWFVEQRQRGSGGDHARDVEQAALMAQCEDILLDRA